MFFLNHSIRVGFEFHFHEEFKSDNALGHIDYITVISQSNRYDVTPYKTFKVWNKQVKVQTIASSSR